ncbi:MAG: TonB-dependent receptor domain-containing protein [Bryobacteraceae bacterium]
MEESSLKLAAQTASGTISGVVRDSTGAVIPGANISASSAETSATRTVIADISGTYEISGLPVGAYNIEASRPGFKTEVRRGIAVEVGRAVAVNFSLSVGEVQQRVEVQDTPPQVDTADATMRGLVGENAIRELPLNGRDWLQLATLQPGVTGGLGQQSAAILTSSRAARGNGENLAISGNRPTENVYLVDGLIVNDYSNGSPGSGLNVNLGVDAVREFSVLTSDYTAQYGLTSGGVVNAIFKSGTNTIHGSAFEFLRNSALDARNFFDGKNIPAFRRNQFGASIGGPIKKDSTFFFADFEALRQFLSSSGSSDTLSLNARNGLLTSGRVNIAPSIQRYLAAFPLPNGSVNGDSAKFNFSGGEVGNESYVVGKIDHNFSVRTTLAGSYQFDDASLSQPDPYNQKRIGSPSRHHNGILSLQHVFSPALVNTARAGVTRTFAADALDISAIDPVASDKSLGFISGAPIGILGVAGLTGTAGGLGGSGSDVFNFTAPQAADDLFWMKGRHALKFGASFVRQDDNFNSANIPLGEWDYGSIADFLTNTPQDFTADLPGTNGARGLRATYFGVYAQDDFHFRPNLTINVGLRYEISTAVTEVNNKVATLPALSSPTPRLGGAFFNNPTLKNFAPRVGFAWDPTGAGKTSIRAGFGIYDILPLPYLLINRTHSTPYFLQGTVSNPPASAFPNGGLGLLSPASTRVAYVEPNPARAYNLQWNLSIQRQLTADLAMTVAYVGSHASHIPQGIEDADQVPVSLVTQTPDGHLLFPTTGTIQRINPNFGRIVATVWRDWSKYNGLLVNVSKRYSHGIAVQAAYTWSKTLDQGSATFSDNEYTNTAGPSYAFVPSLQNGVADFDIAHNFIANATWSIPTPGTLSGFSRALIGGWQIGGIFQVHTGAPFTVKIPVDRARTGNSRTASSSGGQRPDFNPLPGCTPNAINPGQPSNYIRTDCFSFPANGVLGNLGRNTLRGPGLENVDFSIFKNHALLQDKLHVQFRAEAFNLLNHPNFQVGTTSVLNRQGSIISTAGQLTPPTLTTSRQIQFGIRLIW